MEGRVAQVLDLAAITNTVGAPSFAFFGRVAQVLDLAAITNTVGAPSFAFFAKGGYHVPRELRS